MKKIIFVSPVNFESLKQRHQGIALELAKNNFQIFFVNPLYSNGFSCKIREQNNNFKIIDLKIHFKAASYPLIQNIAVKIALKLIKKKLHIKTSDCILWLAEPSCAEFTKEKWQKIIYDCCDLHGNFPNQRTKAWHKYESIIADKSDLITVSHPFIKEHFTKCQQNKCLLLPNATFFKTDKFIHQKDNNSKIKLLSSGAHYEWVDIDWLEMLAKLDNVELHVAGKGRGKAFNLLLQNKKVVFHGELNSNWLLLLMKECDIGLVPFKDIELIKGVDPIKAYDYRAAGLQIWAPYIESLHSNKYINYFIENSEQAKKALENQNNKILNSEKIPTWADRIKQVLPYLQTHE